AYTFDPVNFCTAFPNSPLCQWPFPQATSSVRSGDEANSVTAVPHSALPGDVGMLVDLTAVFRQTAAGTTYVNQYAQNDHEIGRIMTSDPRLMWDSYRTLQDFMPGLDALTNGLGSQVTVTQDMVDHAYSVWSRIAADANPELAAIINNELAQSNNLQDFVGLSFDEWALAIGVEPPSQRIYLPIVHR
ncbi:MAG: hypothetical protein P8183_21620, partial [Anaerolineae bacterium]